MTDPVDRMLAEMEPEERTRFLEWIETDEAREVIATHWLEEMEPAGTA